MHWCHKQFISIPNNKLHGFPFKVIPLESNALFHASMHCWKDSSGMPLSSIVMALLMASMPSKRVPLMIPLLEIRWIERLFQYGDVFLSQELPDAQGVVSRCIVVVKQPRFVLPQLSSLLVHWAKQKPQDLFVDLLIDRLALWQNSLWTMLLTSKNMINMTLILDFDCLAFFGLSDVWDFHWHLWCLVSGSYSKIHVSSPVMTLRSKCGSVWRRSVMSWHTCMRCSFWSSFSSLGTIFVQTFRMRGGVNKSMWNKIQWLQKAMITVLYSQDIMLDDNTICIYICSSHSTPSPVTFQTDLLSYICIY